MTLNAGDKRKAGTPKGAKRGGRNGSQPVYTQALADEICDRLADGESLRGICKDAHMPDEKAVRLWVIERADTFAPQYARAREMGFDSIAEEVIAISDTDCMGPDGYVDNGAVQRARLMSDNRKWFLSKAMPRKFGDKVEISGDANAPLLTRIELVAVRPKQITIDHQDDGGDDGTK